MPTKKLTDAVIKRLPKPAQRTDIKDSNTRGLTLRHSPSGRKTWRMRYMVNGHVRVLALGDYPTMRLSDARKAVETHHEEIAEGRDPQAEVQAMPSVAEFAKTYIERYAMPNKKTWQQDKRILEQDVIPVIGTLKIDRVKRRDLVRVIDRVKDRGSTRQADLTYAITRKMVNYAVERGVLETSPATHIKQSKNKARDVVLDDDAIRLLWKSTINMDEAEQVLSQHHLTCNALRLMLLTAARSSEVSGIRLDELDTHKKIWTLPGERSKNGLTHTVPLSGFALEVIDDALVYADDAYLFPRMKTDGHLDVYAPRKAMTTIFGGIYTPHDLRRTAATRITGLGFNRLIIDKILNHKDNSISGVYDRHSYDNEKRDALDTWAKTLRGLI